MDREKTHHKETHGRSDDINEDTPVEKVKGPSVFERAKEEIEALVETIHSKKKHDHDPHTKETHGRSNDIDEDTPVEKVKGPNVFERAKEEIEALVETIHPKKKHDHDPPAKKDESAKEESEAIVHKEKIHHKETHGTSNDIDENTPMDKVKGPSVFGRVKEEFVALVDTIHPKKEIDYEAKNKEKVGFWELLARWFENCCSPRSGKKD